MFLFKKKKRKTDNNTITFKAQFEVFHGVRVEPPKNLKYNEFFECEFSTGARPLECKITYLGKNEIMKENTWYDCEIMIIDIGYHSPFNPDPSSSREKMEFEKEYWLHSGVDIIGKCKLLSIIKNDEI